MQRNDSVIKLLADLVGIDSQSQHGNIAIISYLSKLFKGYEQEKQSWIREQDDVRGENLIVKIPGKSSGHALVFVCHLDTVPTSSAWETDPFILEENGGNLYGLGACDTKGGIASLIEAAITLSEKSAFDTYLIFDGDEEVYSTGAIKLAKKFLIKNPHFIFIEPTDSELHIAQRALLKFDVTTHGSSIHASQATPEKNNKENAIHKMGKVLTILSEDAFSVAQAKHTYLPSSTQNFGLLSGGTARNVFADTASVTVDRRLIPEQKPIEEFQRIKTLVTQEIPGTSITLDQTLPAFAMPNDNPFVTQVFAFYTSVDPKARIGAFQAWSEAGLFADKGDVVILGPGSLVGQAHRANEFISAQELFKFVKVYQKIMQGITL